MNFTFRQVLLALQKTVPSCPAFEYLEKRLLDKSDHNLPFSPTFIIGPPRSGSTLLYQLLASNFNFSYFSNITAFFYKSPAWATKKFWSEKKRYDPDDYKSEYGLIEGIRSPSEAGQLYRYWFESGKMDDKERKRISKTIGYISYFTSRPFIWKNLDLSKKIDEINQIFSNPVFLFMKRDPLYTAQSLLISRRKRYGDYKRWFGIKPPGYEKITEHPPHEQVVLQVKSLEDHIEKSIKKNEIKGIHLVNYEELCKNTELQLKSIDRFYNDIGLTLQRISRDTPSLASSNMQKVSESDWKKLKGHVKKHF